MLSEVTPVGWPAVGSILAGFASVGLGASLLRYRDAPGVEWFLGAFAAQSTWCLSYGLSLLVFDAQLRAAFEGITWLAITWTAIAFLGFALEYTGRTDVLGGAPFTAVLGFGVLSSLLVVTNPVHGLVWSTLEFAPVFGVATVTYTFGPVAYAIVGVGTLLVALAVFLLVDTLFNYGPLYRRETAAVAVSTLPPGFALLAWLFQLGPYPQLNFAAIMFLPHVALDAYAFGRVGMFERNPTTSRAAERTAIDDIEDPIVVVTPDREVVRLNPAAAALLSVDPDDALGRQLDAVLPGAIGEALDDRESIDQMTVDVGFSSQTYAVSVSPLTDPAGTHVGYTVVLSDVTARERRRQQLEVLNRVLRHNLRNDATVVHGYAELLVEELEEPGLRGMAASVEESAAALAALGENAGTVDALQGDVAPTSVDLRALLERIVDRFRDDHEGATIELDVPDELAVVVAATPFEAIVENALGNAIEHHDGAGVETDGGGPWARVAVEPERSPETEGGADGTGHVEHDASIVVSVADDGPGIPDHELAVLEAGQETDLEHGSGLGLWVIKWSADALGAALAFRDRAPRGTVVRARIPVRGTLEDD